MEFINNVLDRLINDSELFIETFIEHIYISTIAVFLAGSIGVLIGISMVYNKALASVFLSITSFLYTIPAIAMFGILVVITGIGNTSAIIALVIYGLLPIIRNTYVGILEVDKDVIEAAKGMGTTPIQMLFKIQLPLAVPIIFTGFRTMVIMTIALGGIASFIGAGGLGVVIFRGISTYQPPLLFIGSMLVAILAFTTDIILGIIEKKLRVKILGKV